MKYIAPSGERPVLLIIGNGFDLACGLPTRYSDFLAFCKAVKNARGISDSKVMLSYPENHEYSELLSCLTENECNMFNETNEALRNNFWFRFFQELFERELCGPGWIDFEAEISFLIEYLDRDDVGLRDQIADYLYEPVVRELKYGSNKKEKLELFYEIFEEPQLVDLTFDQFRKKLHEDLEQINCALELYLILIQKASVLDIPPLLRTLAPDYLLTFNYTNTHKVLYPNLLDENVCHIHGKCRTEFDTPNSIVIGVEESRTKLQGAKRSHYRAFQKFYQREKKSIYRDFTSFKAGIDELSSSDSSVDLDIYIYGHSLDYSDTDALSDFLKNAKAKVTIYCFGEIEKYRENVINLIGVQDYKMKLDTDTIAYKLIEPNVTSVTSEECVMV